MSHRIEVISTSSAADLGYRALADLAHLAEGIDYRIIGGHMVQLLLHVYPIGTPVRMTADADAGINHVVAAGQRLHRGLLQFGYEDVAGNSYRRSIAADQTLSVDLLTEGDASGKSLEVQGRAFDAAPGLSLALSQDALNIEAGVSLVAGGRLCFQVPVPDVEVALIMKSLAWNVRMADRDIVDIGSLLEIVEGTPVLERGWAMSDEVRASKGTRLDAARALYRLGELIERGRMNRVGLRSPPRVAALIRKHISKPRTVPFRR